MEQTADHREKTHLGSIKTLAAHKAPRRLEIESAGNKGLKSGEGRRDNDHLRHR